MQATELYIMIFVLVGVLVMIGVVWWKRAWLEALDMLDWLHWVSVLIGSAQLGFILWYYIPLMNWRAGGGYFSANGTDIGEPENKFISDFLFKDSIYRAVMTCFVALQLGVCALFVTRLRSRREDGPFMFCIEITFFVCAWVGWTTLCAQYTNPDGGGMSRVHAAGVGVFIACSLAYVFMMSWNVYALFEKLSYLAEVEFAMLAVLLIGSIVLGCHFIYNALNGAPDAWVTEHIAFVLFVACHMLLFFIDSSHLRHQTIDSPLVDIEGVSGGFVTVFDGVRIQLVH